MKNLSIFLYEWKHFIRNPFKVVALLLFVVASVYGLHKGASLYQEQSAEVEKIEQKVREEKQKQIVAYQEGKFTPEDRPRVDLRKPVYAIDRS